MGLGFTIEAPGPRPMCKFAWRQCNRKPRSFSSGSLKACVRILCLIYQGTLSNVLLSMHLSRARTAPARTDAVRVLRRFGGRESWTDALELTLCSDALPRIHSSCP